MQSHRRAPTIVGALLAFIALLPWLLPASLLLAPAAAAAPADLRPTATMRALPKGSPLARAGFTTYASLYGVTLAATKSTPRNKAQHAFAVLVQYLDNDEDGRPDNSRVARALARQNATMLMFGSWREMERFDEGDAYDRLQRQQPTAVAILTAPETLPRGGFDAALEEDLHLITQFGYARAYPGVWGEEPGTRLRDLRESAESQGYYSYADPTCDDACLDTEFLYWSLTSLLGAQAARCDEIADEWDLCTPTLMESGAPEMTALLRDPRFTFPTRLPDGHLR